MFFGLSLAFLRLLSKNIELYFWIWNNIYIFITLLQKTTVPLSFSYPIPFLLNAPVPLSSVLEHGNKALSLTTHCTCLLPPTALGCTALASPVSFLEHCVQLFTRGREFESWLCLPEKCLVNGLSVSFVGGLGVELKCFKHASKQIRKSKRWRGCGCEGAAFVLRLTRLVVPGCICLATCPFLFLCANAF